jgi:O-antigen/teichoic acid export membrane protein
MPTSENKSSLLNRLMKASSVYALSGLIRNLVSFLMLPIYTRYLSPEDYGIAALMVFTVSLIEMVFASSLIGHAPQKFYHEKEYNKIKNEVISSSLISSTVICGSLTILAMLNSHWIAETVLDDSALQNIVMLFLTLVTTQTIENIGLIYVRLLNQYKLFFKLSMYKLVMQVSANIVFVVYLNMGILGMAIATAIASILFASFIFIYVIKSTGWHFNPQLTKRMIQFVAPLWPSGALSLYIGSSHIYFMKLFVETEEIGLFSIAERLAAVLSLLLFMPIFNYWSAERFRIKDRHDFDQLHDLIFRSVFSLLMIAATALSLFAPFFLMVLTTEPFYPAKEAVPPLAFGYLLNGMAQFYHFSFLLKNKNSQITKISVFVVFVTTLANLALIPKLGYEGAAIGVFITNIFFIGLSSFYSKKFYDCNFHIGRVFLSLTIVIALVYGNKILIGQSDNLIATFMVSAITLIVSSIIIFFINFSRSEISRISSHTTRFKPMP